MAVLSTLAKNMTSAAIVDAIDLHRSRDVRAGAFSWRSPDLVTGWHHHSYHQIEYALTGVAEVETSAGRYLLPPEQAIWIPFGLSHNTTLRGVESISVFFDPGMVADTFGSEARVLAAAPVLREMIRYALRWPIGRASEDPAADVFFQALARVVEDLLDRASPLWLPTTRDPTIAAVIGYIDTHLQDVSTRSACAAVGISDRTLRRQFLARTGLPFGEYVVKARLMRAMSLLTATERSVLDIALSVGFDSPSGFNRAFKQLTGGSPSAYRKRGAARAGD